MTGRSSQHAGHPTLAPWDGALYAANTAHHRAHDGWFLARCPFEPTDVVLDVGCGSGDFTRTLAGLVPEGHVVGIDAQPSMVAEAVHVALPNQSFAVGPAQRLASLDEVVAHSPYDAVITRAVMQWIPLDEHGPILRQVHDLLRPGGWFRADLGAAGNIPHVVPLMDDVSSRHGGPQAPWTFPDAGTWLELLEAAGFHVEDNAVRTVAQRRPFDRASLRGWLESQAFQAYEVGLDPRHRTAFREEVIARLDEVARPDRSLDQTYVRVDAFAYRGP